MIYGRLKQMIADYNNGNGLSNIQLANKYGITASTVRANLIKEGVYVAKRKNYPRTERSAAWQLVHAERLLKRVIDWHESGDLVMALLYKDIKDYFKTKK